MHADLEIHCPVSIHGTRINFLHNLSQKSCNLYLLFELNVETDSSNSVQPGPRVPMLSQFKDSQCEMVPVLNSFVLIDRPYLCTLHSDLSIIYHTFNFHSQQHSKCQFFTYLLCFSKCHSQIHVYVYNTQTLLFQIKLFFAILLMNKSYRCEECILGKRNTFTTLTSAVLHDTYIILFPYKHFEENISFLIHSLAFHTFHEYIFILTSMYCLSFQCNCCYCYILFCYCNLLLWLHTLKL